MVGNVVVVDKGGSGVDTPQAVAQRGAAEQAKLFAEGEKAEADFLAQPAVQTKNPNGSNTWKVPMGTSTEHTDIFAFHPVPAKVKAGDSVTFVNDSAAPHTASFFAQQPAIQSPQDPRTDKALPGPSPQALDSSQIFNTGVLPPNAPPGGGPPEAARSFTFSVPKAGSYT